MSDDERAIRDMIATWITASEKGDLAAVLPLMSDDVVFLVPGREPFGKEAFATVFSGMKNLTFKAESEIKEITVAGDWAWCRTHLRITVTPPGGTTLRRSGATLSILKRQPGGAWVIVRDANLLSAE